MSKGRPASPASAKRGTANRPKTVKPPVTVPGTEVAQVLDPYPPPATLPEEVHQVWRSIVSDLGGANHMRDSFLPALTAYCESVYLHAAASENIHEFGVLVKGQNGPMPNPLIKVQKDAAATMLRYAETLGLTPAARIRVGLMEVTGMSLLAGLGQALDGKK